MSKVSLGRVVGKSAYELWLDEGNTGTLQDYIASLKGEPGDVNTAQMNTAIADAIAQVTRKNFDALCTPFSQDGGLVQCRPVENYPLSVSSEIVAVQAGSGDPSPDNVRAITGWSSVQAVRCGENLIPSISAGSVINGIAFIKNIDGSVTANGAATGYASCYGESLDAAPLRGHTVTLKGTSHARFVSQLYIICSSGSVYKSCTGNNMAAITFTMPDDAIAMRFEAYVGSGSTVVNATIYPQLEIGTESTGYTPYTGTTYTQPLLDANGNPITVYGGRYDWDTGVLTVTQACKALAGTEVYTTWGTYSADFGLIFRVSLGATVATYAVDRTPKFICTHYKTNINGTANDSDTEYAFVSAPSAMFKARYETIDEFKAYLASQYAAGTPVTIVYELATPYTIQLPAHQIPAIAGVNTIYSDTGNTTVSGRSDTTDKAMRAEYADTANVANVAINCAEAETSVLAKRATYAVNAGVVRLATAADATWRKYPGDADDAVTITQDGEYIHVVKPASKYARYAGVYLRVRYDSLDDLDGDFTLEIPPGKLPSPTLRILYGLHDWGNTTVNGTIGFTMNTVYNLKELLQSVEGVSYADRNELYITVLTYRITAGDSPEVDFRARLKFSASNAEVIATDFNASATERIKEIADGNSKYVTCWGDSLTAGGGWTDRLQTLSGMTVYNGGTGGENARCIVARQGADVMVINGITIPATTTPVLIASRASDGGIKTQAGYTVMPLLQGGAHVNPCKIGDIEGTLAWTGSSYADTTGTWTFTRSAAGDAVTITRPTPIRTDFDRNRNAPHLMIIFMGQNGGYTDLDDLVRQHRLMIEHSRAKHTLVLGLSSGTAAQRAEYEVRMTKEFGRYFLSLRAYLATPLYAADGTTITSCYGLDDAGLTPTADDLTAIAEGRTPPQMLSDSVHYTTATKEVIGKLIYKTACELGIF